MLRCLITLGGLLLLLPSLVSGEVLRVSADAPPGGDGTSWEKAFAFLGDALEAAGEGDEIWVREGVYHPAPPGGDFLLSFELPGGVRLYGGFNGTESDRAGRDPALYETVLSGDLNGDDGPGWANMQLDNSRHVVRATDAGTTTVLDGFTVRSGWAWSSSGYQSAGAGMLLLNSSPAISNCTFERNLAHLGAAIYTTGGAPAIQSCEFRNNLASDGRGGAIYHRGEDSPVTLTIRESRFIANTASSAANSGGAGAIWSDFNGVLDIEGCVFEGNEAKWRFNYGSFPADGGALLIFGEGSRISRTRFEGNRAHIGGAAWIARDTTIANCLFVNNEAYRVSSNEFDYGGFAGAVYASGGTNLITGSTLHANHARSYGGILVLSNSGTTLANSILWTNTSTEVDAKLVDQQLGGPFSQIRYSCVRGLLTQEPGEDPPNPADFPGCLDTDPLFLDTDGADDVVGNGDDDLRLASESPCIDAGDNGASGGGWALDFAGLPRLVDHPEVEDTGLGTPPVVDMGCFEHQGASFAVEAIGWVLF